jgi:NADH-quinone oxidoreductase subunit L
MSLAPWLLIWPLSGWIFLGLMGRRLRRPAPGIIACATVAASLLTALIVFGSYRSTSDGTGVAPAIVPLFAWFGAGAFSVDASLLIDPLSLVMALVVTSVGLLIHVYSIGYMADDAGASRYFAYLNLFVFSMLLLVLAGNLLVLFVGWEMVGVCSYLLIGYWFQRPAAATAGRKAFVVNRIGDAAFLMGLFLLVSTVGSLDILKIREAAGDLAPATRTLAALLLFAGATGKSGQFPLHVWLPDAMEGPTPVSALIHAATMVTAGVFLIARLDVLFMGSPVALAAIAIVGALTAFYAATCALRQHDLKRVLAFSTISQLGYMFVAMGAIAPAVGVFHLVTHAFFKALLFLGAGSVMHATHDVIDMRRLGGLARPLRWTLTGFWIGGLALAGVPPFAGFFSKDLILEHAFVLGQSTGNYLPYLLGVLTALITATYTTRMIALTFYGKPADTHAHPHESGVLMLAPMAVLAVLSITGGFLGSTLTGEPLLRFLGGAFLATDARAAAHPPTAILLGVSVAAALGGIMLGWRLHRDRRDAGWGALGRFLEERWYVDALYDRAIVRPGHALARWCAGPVDIGVIDATVNGVGRDMLSLGRVARRLQTGYARQYALSVLVGTVLILVFWMLR